MTIDTTDHRLTRIEQQLAVLAERVNGLEKRLDSIEKRLATLENRLWWIMGLQLALIIAVLVRKG